MSKLKSLLLSSVGAVAVAAVAIGGTVAYLQDSDSDVNVMTLGNVQIEQIEQERNEAGELVEFSQAKPAYPAVGNIAWDEDGLEVNGTEYKVFDDGLKNVVDKIVTVNNTGKSDAYVRTLVAIEAPDGDPDNLIHLNYNGTDVTSSGNFMIEIDGVDYYVTAYTYKEALAGGKKSAPSLMQVFLDKKTTNEDCAKFGDAWEILVLSQAVQTNGFADAQTALNTAFGEVNAANAAVWFGDEIIPTAVSTPDDMREAMKTPGAKIVLSDDVIIDDDKGTGYALYAKYDCEIDLNGHDLVVDMPAKEFYGVIYALKGAKVNIVGDGSIQVNAGVGNWVWCTGAAGETEINIYGGNWIQDSNDFDPSTNDYCEGIYANREGVINIYGGFFNWGTVPQYTLNESREGVINVYGGTFVNFDPSQSHDSDGSYVADGYKVVSETQANGDIWYTVVAQ